MKTFKQHVKEGMSPLGVGVSTSNSPEDVQLVYITYTYQRYYKE